MAKESSATSAVSEAGFALQLGPPGRLIQGRAWGFWGRPVAERFQRELSDTLRQIERPSRLLLDMSQLLPQSDEVQVLLRQAMSSASLAGLGQAAIIVTNAITKLQLTRLAREARVSQWAFVASPAQAHQHLGL